MVKSFTLKLERDAKDAAVKQVDASLPDSRASGTATG
jgi:hypothetical protein